MLNDCVSCESLKAKGKPCWRHKDEAEEKEVRVSVPASFYGGKPAAATPNTWTWLPGTVLEDVLSGEVWTVHSAAPLTTGDVMYDLRDAGGRCTTCCHTDVEAGAYRVKDCPSTMGLLPVGTVLQTNGAPDWTIERYTANGNYYCDDGTGYHNVIGRIDVAKGTYRAKPVAVGPLGLYPLGTKIRASRHCGGDLWEVKGLSGGDLDVVDPKGGAGSIPPSKVGLQGTADFWVEALVSGAAGLALSGSVPSPKAAPAFPLAVGTVLQDVTTGVVWTVLSSFFGTLSHLWHHDCQNGKGSGFIWTEDDVTRGAVAVVSASLPSQRSLALGQCLRYRSDLSVWRVTGWGPATGVQGWDYEVELEPGFVSPQLPAKHTVTQQEISSGAYKVWP